LRYYHAAVSSGRLTQALGANVRERIIRTHRRLLIGLIAFVLLAGEYAGFVADKLVRGYYFKDFRAHVPGVVEIAILVLAVYLLLVAATGRWLIVRSGSRHG
jgi:hypothetical protein